MTGFKYVTVFSSKLYSVVEAIMFTPKIRVSDVVSNKSDQQKIKQDWSNIGNDMERAFLKYDRGNTKRRFS